MGICVVREGRAEHAFLSLHRPVLEILTVYAVRVYLLSAVYRYMCVGRMHSFLSFQYISSVIPMCELKDSALVSETFLNYCVFGLWWRLMEEGGLAKGKIIYLDSGAGQGQINLFRLWGWPLFRSSISAAF